MMSKRIITLAAVSLLAAGCSAGPTEPAGTRLLTPSLSEEVGAVEELVEDAARPKAEPELPVPCTKPGLLEHAAVVAFIQVCGKR